MRIAPLRSALLFVQHSSNLNDAKSYQQSYLDDHKSLENTGIGICFFYLKKIMEINV